MTGKFLLVDLDGTIRRPSDPNARFISSPKGQEAIPAVFRILQDGDWDDIIGITNQGGVAAGHKSILDAIAEQHYTLSLFPMLSSIYFCPDYDGLEYFRVDEDGGTYSNCRDGNLDPREIPENILYQPGNGPRISFRKPGEGMLLMAMVDYSIDIRNSEVLYVGDRDEDYQAAMAAGIPFQWADAFRGEIEAVH